MSDFLSREADILGNEFSTSLHRPTASDDIDFDRAASAFPDIDIDSGDFLNGDTFASQPRPSVFSSTPILTQTITEDEPQVMNAFPEIDIDSGETFAPQPHPSMFSSTPILTQTISEDEPQVIRDWRERQQEEIRSRDEASKLRRDQTIDKAERAIEDFYENYSKKKERNIRDNKCGLFFYPSFLG